MTSDHYSSRDEVIHFWIYFNRDVLAFVEEAAIVHPSPWRLPRSPPVGPATRFGAVHDIEMQHEIPPALCQAAALMRLLSIEENVLKHFKITGLSGGDYTALIREAALAGMQGGTIYDAVLIKCAAKSEAEKILTLNLRHFQNIAPKSIRSQIVVP